MIIKKMKIISSEGKRVFNFSIKTLIHSKKNSVGKSTILRILFYGLGYPVPSTYKLKFKDLKIWITFERKNATYQVYRFFNYLELKKNGELFYTDPISANLSEWYSLIWGIDALPVLNNLIGAIYLEQDKGWTLLNRGKVIGSISFNVRDLLIGLSKNNNTLVKEINEKDHLKRLHDETKAILGLEEFTNYENESVTPIKDSELLKEYKNIKVQERFLKNRINKLKKYIRRTNNLKDYIYSLNLMIKNPDKNKKPIRVSKKENNLLHFDTTVEFLKTEVVSLQLDLNDAENKKVELGRKIDENTTSLFPNQDVVKSSIKALSQIKIDRDLIEKRQDSLEKEMLDLNKKIDVEFAKNREIIEETENWIKKFARILGVEDIIKSHSNYLLTHDIKSISGTQYYKVVFSFKMAYIKVIENHTDTKLPIVLDSPSGREVTKANIEKVIGILNKYFKNNQIIIASIFDYSLKEKKRIEIKNKIFENEDQQEDDLLDQDINSTKIIKKNYLN